MAEIRFRVATGADVEAVAALHTDSWRRHYRGALADAYLDGDLAADHTATWADRLAGDPGPGPNHRTTLAVADDGALAGFVHTVLDESAAWGSLVDNLHVAHDHRRRGLGTRLLEVAAELVVARAWRPGLYLWVLERNIAARSFYQALGGEELDAVAAPAPRGDPALLVGVPRARRVAWPDPRVLLTSP